MAQSIQVPSDKCWKKLRHLNPFKKDIFQNKALVGMRQDPESDYNDVCLFNKHINPVQQNDYICLAKYEDSIHAGSTEWFVDSACTAYMTYNRDAFSNYKSIQGETVDLGADSRADILGQGDVVLRISVKAKYAKCTTHPQREACSHTTVSTSLSNSNGKTSRVKGELHLTMK